MSVSEPLPHFVDDLLGFLHETHPTYATLDGVHTHDDLLEDLSRPAVEAEAHALSGYLRRLGDINPDGLTGTERLEHGMLGPHVRARGGPYVGEKPPVLRRYHRDQFGQPGVVYPRAGVGAGAACALEVAADASPDSGGPRQHPGSPRHLRQGRHRDDARAADV